VVYKYGILLLGCRLTQSGYVTVLFEEFTDGYMTGAVILNYMYTIIVQTTPFLTLLATTG